MKKLLPWILFLGACTAVSEGTTTTEPTVSTTEQTAPDGAGADFADPPAVDTSGVVGPDGEVVAHESFWFAWSQFHPETLLWSGE